MADPASSAPIAADPAQLHTTEHLFGAGDSGATPVQVASASQIAARITAWQGAAAERLAQAQGMLASLAIAARTARGAIASAIRPIARDAESLSDAIAEDAEASQSNLLDEAGEPRDPDTYDADYRCIDDQSNKFRDALAEVSAPDLADAFAPITQAIIDLRRQLSELGKAVKAVQSSAPGAES